MTHKEAIERIKTRFDKWALDDEDMKAIQNIIPELAENEDEKIRKGILETIKQCPDTFLNPKNRDEMIVYLEKLNDFQFNYPGLYFYDGKKLHFQGNPAMEENPYDFAMSQQEKQKEQKPAEWSEKDKLHLNNAILATMSDWGVDSNTSRWLKSLPERFSLQPKQEWSEEDDAILKEIVSFFKDGTVKLQHDLDLYAGFLEKKFKSLRPQPKSELTLLDENIIKAAVAFVEQNDHFNVWRGIDKHTVIKALRSLKPSWKPSEEQMRALDSAINYLTEHTCTPGNSLLISLSTDLQKLYFNYEIH